MLTLSRKLLAAWAALLGSTATMAADDASDAPAAPPQKLTEFERKLIDLPADTWYRAPNTKMLPVCAPDSFDVRGVLGCTAAITAWSGGTWDPVHKKMLVWGGGHSDYYGNEIYAFDVPTMKWQRLTDPSPGPYNRDPLNDGRPVSRHTYDGLQYLVRADRFFAIGGSRAADGGGTDVTWLFDVPTRKWTNAQPQGKAPGGYELASGYDRETGHVLVRSNLQLFEYAPERNAWSELANFSVIQWPLYERWGAKRGVVDTKRRLFWSFGSTDYLVWDIAKRRIVSDDWTTRGGTEFVSKRGEQVLFRSGGVEIHGAPAPAVDYDSKADQMVGWVGGAPWILDLKTKEWRQAKTKSPLPKPQPLGNYGRWRYLEQYNVFVLVHDAREDVFFYKNTAGGPR